MFQIADARGQEQRCFVVSWRSLVQCRIAALDLILVLLKVGFSPTPDAASWIKSVSGPLKKLAKAVDVGATAHAELKEKPADDATIVSSDSSALAWADFERLAAESKVFYEKAAQHFFTAVSGSAEPMGRGQSEKGRYNISVMTFSSQTARGDVQTVGMQARTCPKGKANAVLT
jgi:hypothetical protein